MRASAFDRRLPFLEAGASPVRSFPEALSPYGAYRQYLSSVSQLLPSAAADAAFLLVACLQLFWTGLVTPRCRRNHHHLCGRALAHSQPRTGIARLCLFISNERGSATAPYRCSEDVHLHSRLCGSSCGSSGATPLFSSPMSTLREPQTTSSSPFRKSKHAERRHPPRNQATCPPDDQTHMLRIYLPHVTAHTTSNDNSVVMYIIIASARNTTH